MDTLNDALARFANKDVDYTVRFIIENNFNAVQYKLATYGIPVNSTLEAYVAVTDLKGTNAFKDVLNVPYLNDATNGTGGLVSSVTDSAQKRNILDGFNNFISNLTDGDIINAVGNSIGTVITSATGGVSNIIGTSFTGVTGVVGTSLTGAAQITAPLIGGIVPSAQNNTQLRTGSTEPTKDNNTIIIVAIVGFILLGVGAYFLLAKGKKASAK